MSLFSLNKYPPERGANPTVHVSDLFAELSAAFEKCENVHDIASSIRVVNCGEPYEFSGEIAAFYMLREINSGNLPIYFFSQETNEFHVIHRSAWRRDESFFYDVDRQAQYNAPPVLSMRSGKPNLIDLSPEDQCLVVRDIYMLTTKEARNAIMLLVPPATGLTLQGAIEPVEQQAPSMISDEVPGVAMEPTADVSRPDWAPRQFGNGREECLFDLLCRPEPNRIAFEQLKSEHARISDKAIAKRLCTLLQPYLQTTAGSIETTRRRIRRQGLNRGWE